MSFKPYTEKIKKEKIGICSILGRIHLPEADPRIRIRIRIKMIWIRNTAFYCFLLYFTFSVVHMYVLVLCMFRKWT